MDTDFYKATCANCGKLFSRHNRHHPKYQVKYSEKVGRNYNWSGNQYCSRKCLGEHQTKIGTVTQDCSWCGTSVTTTVGELKKSKSGRIFCNRSCAASFNNTQKRKSRRSKCEEFLFKLLKKEFPSLLLLPNDKTMLQGFEVDIAVPQLKLAIEWNGIVHFKPIYGQEKLNNIQNRDTLKLNLANERNINLIIIPDLVSTEKYVKEAFQSIKKIISTEIQNSPATIRT